MYGSARIVWAMYTAFSVNAMCRSPNTLRGRSSSRTPSPASTGGSARLALARICSARRPRNRPSPITSPIGNPITSATAVEMKATLIVTHATLRM